jgi:hypothetical protein
MKKVSKRKAVVVQKSFEAQMSEVGVSKRPVLGMMIFSTGVKKTRGKQKL